MVSKTLEHINVKENVSIWISTLKHVPSVNLYCSQAKDLELWGNFHLLGNKYWNQIGRSGFQVKKMKKDLHDDKPNIKIISTFQKKIKNGKFKQNENHQFNGLLVI